MKALASVVDTFTSGWPLQPFVEFKAAGCSYTKMGLETRVLRSDLASVNLVQYS